MKSGNMKIVLVKMGDEYRVKKTVNTLAVLVGEQLNEQRIRELMCSGRNYEIIIQEE